MARSRGREKEQDIDLLEGDLIEVSQNLQDQAEDIVARARENNRMLQREIERARERLDKIKRELDSNR